jgi:hypothetical protein
MILKVGNQNTIHLEFERQIFEFGTPPTIIMMLIHTVKGNVLYLRQASYLHGEQIFFRLK